MTLLAPPGVVHAQEGVKDELAVASEIKFVLSDVHLKKMLGSAPVLIPSAQETMGLIERIVTESVRFSTVSQSFIHSYLNALLHIWAQEYSPEEGESSGIFDTAGFSQLTKSILRFLEDNYSGNVSLQTLADKLGYNKFYICNAFKQDTGITIFDCLSLIRVRHAAELISYSEMPLESVGASVGFSSISHFNRVFKQTAGIPPGQYRRHYPAEILIVEQTEMAFDKDVYTGVVKNHYAEPFIVSVLARQKISGEMLSQIIKKSSDEST
jgi:AraC-like DNA-binding protein